MKALDRKKKEVELMKCEAALASMELNILEREEDIERIKGAMKTQVDHINILKAELAQQ